MTPTLSDEQRKQIISWAQANAGTENETFNEERYCGLIDGATHYCQQKDEEIGELKSKLRGDKPLSGYVIDYKEANGIKQWLGGETKWDLQKVNSMNSHEQLTALQGYQNIIRDLDAMFYAVEEGVSSKDEEMEGLKDALSSSESIADGLEKSKQLLDEEIARLRKALEEIAHFTEGNLYKSDLIKMVVIAKEALKPIIP